MESKSAYKNCTISWRNEYRSNHWDRGHNPDIHLTSYLHTHYSPILEKRIDEEKGHIGYLGSDDQVVLKIRLDITVTEELSLEKLVGRDEHIPRQQRADSKDEHDPIHSPETAQVQEQTTAFNITSDKLFNTRQIPGSRRFASTCTAKPGRKYIQASPQY